jgi:hypothetical protein
VIILPEDYGKKLRTGDAVAVEIFLKLKCEGGSNFTNKWSQAQRDNVAGTLSLVIRIKVQRTPRTEMSRASTR